MKFYTVYASEDQTGVWLAIDQLPALPQTYANEVDRMKLYRPGIVVTCIITSRNIDRNRATGLIRLAFDNPQSRLTVDLKKPVTQTAQKPTGKKRAYR